MTPFLRIEDLRVSFSTEAGPVHAVNGVSLAVEKGKTLAIVGESGSGKSTIGSAVMGLHNRRTTHVDGLIEVGGQGILSMSSGKLRQLRGSRMAMIFQDPLSSLHPCYTVGRQLVEAVTCHGGSSRRAARRRALDMLMRVGIPDASRRIDDYPHEFSGGMRQRVMIAMAVMNDPELLIADEPTTALDVTIQAQIIELLGSLQEELGTAIVLITHDLGVVARAADDVCVVYGGKIVEQGSVRDVFYRPQMPYTWGLLESLPGRTVGKRRLSPIPGQPPSLMDLPPGCLFQQRCEFADFVPEGRCLTEAPDLQEAGSGHRIRCHLSSSIRSAESGKHAAKGRG